MQQPASHGPCRLLQYYQIHESIMEQFRRQEFVGSDTLELIDVKSRLFLAGEIGCKGRIIIEVTKEFEYLDEPSDSNPRIQTIMYAYNVSVLGSGNVFRYDNQHVHAGHADRHHKHAFAWPNNTESAGSPRWIGHAGWPTLGVVIEEARTWHADNYSRLHDPEAYATNLRNGLRL